ncbi:MAG TPA: ABC transporter substrate-binding protein [Longimicrobium sp.]|nr:ABC transporter substrate-binding protein [Longimicrobium sp.]
MTANDLDRRAFIRSAGALLLAGSGFRWISGPRIQDALRLAFVSAPDAAGAARGVTLGVEEAARTGELMGRRIELVTLDSIEAAASLAADAHPAALVGGSDEASCRALGELAARMDSIFVNIGCRADVLRGDACGGVYHVEASTRMYADALAARGGDAAEATEAVLWHPSLERFGAAQLNDRFRVRFGGEMDSGAWAGWMAVKVLWEASLRARTTEAEGLRAYLERDATQFDGHKGWPLSFRPWDHQLRQPLYLVAPADGGTRVVGEVPARRSGDEAPSRELLDRLGTDASTSTCSLLSEPEGA